MNIDFELYRIFYVVAQNKNITVASKELNISQPAVSKAIKNLEEQLGGDLFVRTRRGVVLTSEGEEFFRYISKAMEYIMNAENKFTDMLNLETGHIRIGVSTTLTKYFLASYLQRFHDQYPKITIEIDTSVSDVLFSKLRNGLLELVVFNIADKEYGDDILVYPCLEVQNVFIVGKKYRYLKDQSLSIFDLKNYPLILQSKQSRTRRFLDTFLEQKQCKLVPELELAGNNLVVLFTKLGFGVGYATEEFIKKELAEGELFILDIKEKMPKRKIGIAISKNHISNFSTKKLVELIKEDIF